MNLAEISILSGVAVWVGVSIIIQLLIYPYFLGRGWAKRPTRNKEKLNPLERIWSWPYIVVGWIMLIFAHGIYLCIAKPIYNGYTKLSTHMESMGEAHK